MSRVSWKLPYLNSSFYRFFDRKSPKSINAWSRASTFLFPHLSKNFRMYNGRKFVSIQVKKPLLGYHSGNFCMSKMLGRKIHLRKKKKTSSKK